MIISFKRSYVNKFQCDDCGKIVVKEEPHFNIEFELEENIVFLCEDCGNELQNNLSQEYKKFVDLEK